MSTLCSNRRSWNGIYPVIDKASKALADAKAAAKHAADAARKVAAYSALWMFVALLCGAFTASFAATLGGKQRDAVI